MTEVDIPSDSHILVVDDTEVNREIITAYLSVEGYKVIEAENGVETLDVLSSDQQVDLVLLDILMPNIDGIEVCRRIRQEMQMLTLPIVFVTALSDQGSKVRGVEVGGDDFLTKPVDRIELLSRVRNLLKVKAYHDLRDRQRELLEEELEQAKAQLLRVDRLATLGTLAGGVGHELNNITAVLKSTLYFMQRLAAQGLPPEQEDLERLERVVDHLTTHGHQLLSLGRPGPAHEQRLDLRKIVYKTVEMMRVAGRTKRTKVEIVLPETPVPVTVNRTRIEQVFVNLLGNAADAFADDQGRGVITVSVESSTEELVWCEVADNGCGIDADKLETIFESYYTTKPVGKGTGLGLPGVKQIVESYGGRVEVKSVPGEGSSFKFNLPIADEDKGCP